VDADDRLIELSSSNLLRLNEFGRGILVLNYDEISLIKGKIVGETLLKPTPERPNLGNAGQTNAKP
jgi:hypothetical protein